MMYCGVVAFNLFEATGDRFYLFILCFKFDLWFQTGLTYTHCHRPPPEYLRKTCQNGECLCRKPEVSGSLTGLPLKVSSI